MLDRKESAPGRARADAPVMLRVPLFNALAARLRSGARSVILDLGAARAGTVTFCSQFRCRLDIVDLAAELDVLNGAEPGELAKCAEAVLPPRGAEAVDAVLCWDLLNYLQRPALSALMERVAARARHGALVHVLVVYSAERMPGRPGAYFPDFEAGGENPGEVRLLRAPGIRDDHPAPRYTPDDLGRCLPGYRIERGVLLGNGMQEFLFRL